MKMPEKGNTQVRSGSCVVKDFSVFWDKDRVFPGGQMILCRGLTGSNDRGQGSGVGRPLGRKLVDVRVRWGRSGYGIIYVTIINES